MRAKTTIQKLCEMTRTNKEKSFKMLLLCSEEGAKEFSFSGHVASFLPDSYARTKYLFYVTKEGKYTFRVGSFRLETELEPDHPVNIEDFSDLYYYASFVINGIGFILVFERKGEEEA